MKNTIDQNNEWLLVSEKLPDIEQDVWYFFEVTGVSAGKYYGNEDGLEYFGGDRGFLGGDVTHWMERNIEDVEKPSVPDGWSYPERCLVNGTYMPFDSPKTRQYGQEEAPAPAATDWAHAVSRGVFEHLRNNRDLRNILYNMSDIHRIDMVEAVTQIIRCAGTNRGPDINNKTK